MNRDQYYIEALGRGLGVLEAFSRESPSLSLTEIAEATGLSKSTAFRFTYTLEDLGFLVRDPETKQYRPGLKVLRLGFTALNSLEMGQLAQPYLKALSATCGWTSNMTVRDEAEIVYVARNKTQQIVSVDLHLGSRLPVYCTSMGKAQLIDLSGQELLELLGEGPYERRGPNTITTLDALVAQLVQVRRRGYAVADEELAPGLRAVAAPVRGHTEQLVAAVNVSVPGGRASREELEERLAPLVVATAREISAALGAALER
jgi:IclR family pca regulon transcriptional regulator